MSYSIGPLLLVEHVHTSSIKTGRDEQVSIDRNRRMYIDLRTLGRISPPKSRDFKTRSIVESRCLFFQFNMLSSSGLSSSNFSSHARVSCVCVHTCMHAYVHMCVLGACVYVCSHVEVPMCAFSCRDPQFALGPILHCSYPSCSWHQGVSFEPRSHDSTVLARQLARGHRYYKRATIPLGILTSGPHVCMASVLPSERPPRR